MLMAASGMKGTSVLPPCLHEALLSALFPNNRLGGELRECVFLHALLSPVFLFVCVYLCLHGVSGANKTLSSSVRKLLISAPKFTPVPVPAAPPPHLGEPGGIEFIDSFMGQDSHLFCPTCTALHPTSDIMPCLNTVCS